MYVVRERFSPVPDGLRCFLTLPLGLFCCPASILLAHVLMQAAVMYVLLLYVAWYEGSLLVRTTEFEKQTNGVQGLLLPVFSRLFPRRVQKNAECTTECETSDAWSDSNNRSFPILRMNLEYNTDTYRDQSSSC